MSARNIMRDNAPTAIANDGTTVLKRYRVDGVIYARNIREARQRLLQAVPLYLDDGAIESPKRRRAPSR